MNEEHMAQQQERPIRTESILKVYVFTDPG